ncbi:MAG TPA: glycosyltransferase family 2 protein [Verrucomicrobiae bacterium]|jgi:tetratricopeptide (TPR) repeat protein|nr:glycosyltransferase family 2 protein [Verrucomicrobiae bacterium]
MSAPKIKLSLAMIVKNEARCLARCLRSVQGIADEIIVADTGSTDDTVKIAKEFGAKVPHFDWINDFAAARNFALAQTTGDWILVLDADEHASEALTREIREFIQGPAQIGRLKIVSDFRHNGQMLRSSTFVSRLFPRGAKFEGRIHEQIASPLPRVNLRGELWHDGYLEATKSERNVSLLQAELAREPRNPYLQFQLALEYTSLGRTRDAFACLQKARAAMQPSDPFAPNVVVDFLYAAMELKEFDAGLEAMRTAENELADFPDFHLACGLFYMKYIGSDPAKRMADVPKIEQSYQRSLTLGETEKYKSVHGAGSFLANYNLGVFYHAFGEDARARRCLESAAAQNYAPAISLLKKLKP